jgi:hypothetical protein
MQSATKNARRVSSRLPDLYSRNGTNGGNKKTASLCCCTGVALKNESRIPPRGAGIGPGVVPFLNSHLAVDADGPHAAAPPSHSLINTSKRPRSAALGRQGGRGGARSGIVTGRCLANTDATTHGIFDDSQLLQIWGLVASTRHAPERSAA